MSKKISARHEKFKKKLLEIKRKKWVELRDEYFRILGSDYREQFDSPQDIEDMSLADLIEDTGIKVAEIHKDELVRIDSALRKLEEGTYGKCDGCGAEIDFKRLNVMPFASMCVECQKKTG